MSEMSTIEHLASSQYVWAILFIGLLFGDYRFLQIHLMNLKEDSSKREQQLVRLYEQQRLDSQSREMQLMEHLEKITKTLDSIQHNMASLEEKYDKLSEVWGLRNLS